MLNIDVNLDPHPDPTNSPFHNNLHQTSLNHFPPTQENNRQYQDSFYNNPSHSPLKHPFQKKSNPEDFKADGLGHESDQDIRKGQNEGRIVPERLETLAEQEVKMNRRHKFHMKAHKTLGNEPEGDHDESLENEKKSWNFFEKWKNKKKRVNGERSAPIAKRILIDDVARQKGYYGKEYQAERVVSKNRLALAIARIVVRGRDPKACDILRVALERVNPEALRTVRRARERQKRSRVRNLFVKLRKKVKKPFGPNSTFVFCLGIILFFTILTETFFTTYLVTFVPKGQLSHDNGLLIFCFVADVIFLLRVFINFHIAIYNQGELRTSFRYIAIHYFKTMLIIDAFTLFNIIGYFFLDSSWRALIALAAIRIYKIPFIISVFENYFEVSREIGSLIRVLKLLLILYLYAHVCACALYAVGSHEDNPPGSWITNGGFEGESPGAMYVISTYWSAQTITTVGYGDITPIRIQERILLIAIFLGSSIVLGYIISTIASILAQLRDFTEESWEKLRLIKRYMDDKGLKKETQDRIMRYMRYYLGKENISRIKDSDMMQFLSDNLKDDIVKEINVKMLSDCYMFSHNFGRPFLLAVAKELVERSYGPDEYVYRYQDNDSHSAYFILTGSVELVYGKCNIQVALLEKCDIIGFMAFFAEESRALSAKSLEFTTLFELPRELFMQKFKEFPNEKETFCLIKDNLGLYRNNQNLVNTHCYLCGKSSHLALHCPIVHWYTSPLKVISNYLMRQEKFRRSFKRRDRERFSPYSRRKELQEAAEKIQNSERKSLILGQHDVEFSSTIDEIMDRNIYDLEPLVFAQDLIESKEMNIFSENKGDKYKKRVFTSKPKVGPGEIQTFVTRAYDAYLHNLNLDQVKSFKRYFPHNNIERVSDAIEAQRLAKTYHLPEGILKNFKFGDEKYTRTLRLPSLNAQKSLTAKSTEKNKSSHSPSQDARQSQMSVLQAKRRFVSGTVHSDAVKILRKDTKEGNKEAPSLFVDREEEIEKRSREYCKKVLGSDYDGLMRKFTVMLAESMRKMDEDDSGNLRKNEKR